MRLLANQSFPVNPNTLEINFLRRPMVVEQALRHMHQFLLLNPEVGLDMFE